MEGGFLNCCNGDVFPDQDVRPFDCDRCSGLTLENFDRFSGNIGGFFSNCNEGLHIGGLLLTEFLHRGDGSPQTNSLPAENKKLEKQNKTSRYTDEKRDPIIPTLFVFIASIVGGFFLILIGVERLDNERRFQSAAFIGFGYLLALFVVICWMYAFLRDAPDVF